MRWRATVPFNGLRPGAVYSASDLAGCNMTMLVARGVLEPVQPKTKKAPARPVEPEEL